MLGLEVKEGPVSTEVFLQAGKKALNGNDASRRLLGLEVKEGPVSTEVMIETAAGEKIVSSITTTSAKNLGLKVGGKAYAIIKATNVMIGIED